MKKISILTAIIACLMFSCKKPVKKEKILFITTNVDTLKDAPNGTYLIELAIPFQTFTEQQLDIDIVSPQGGAIPIYHSGDTTSLVKEIIKTDHFINKTAHSLKPSSINPDEYLAVMIPGGYGQFWDTHTNPEIQALIAQIYESGGVIGSVGHGTATLIDVTLSNGEYLVKDKTMTSFPSWNEKNIMVQSDYGKLLPYDMEVQLKKRGAHLKVYNHDKKINYEIVDAQNRLVTASFANSGKFVAQEVLKLITRE